MTKICSAILLSLLIYDFCEIYHLGGNARITEYASSSNNQDTKKISALDLPDRSSIAPLTDIKKKSSMLSNQIDVKYP